MTSAFDRNTRALNAELPPGSSPSPGLGPGRSDQFRSLTQLRRAVEPVAASLAARNATAAQRAGIAELAVDLRRLGEAGALVDFLAADIEFHHLILEASGRHVLRPPPAR